MARILSNPIATENRDDFLDESIVLLDQSRFNYNNIPAETVIDTSKALGRKVASHITDIMNTTIKSPLIDNLT